MDQERQGVELKARTQNECLKGQIESLQNLLAKEEKTRLDEQPRIGVRVVNKASSGGDSWIRRIRGHEEVAEFVVEHLGGRPAESVQFEPIPSEGGKLSLRFGAVPFLTKSRNIFSYEVWKDGAVYSPSVVAKVGLPALLDRFLKDGTAGYTVVIYYLTVCFMDRREDRKKQFEIMFDFSTFAFSIMPVWEPSTDNEKDSV